MRRTIVVGLAAAALVLGGSPAVATGTVPTTGYGPPPRDPVVLTEGLAGPLSFDVVGQRLVVGEAFSGALTLVERSGNRQLVPPTGNDLAAVSVSGSQVTWSQTTYGEEGPTAAVLRRMGLDGTPRTIADLLAFETEENPDGGTTYGFVGLDDACTATLPPFLQPYTGLVDSHPYGSVTARGVTFVADAGANAITAVVEGHRPRTIAVLPPTTVTVTGDMATALELDPCVADHELRLESVPTDVEIGPDNMLYVTTLPGGPEDGSLGANGSLYKVNPWTGTSTRLATGFAGATGLAIAPHGTAYVTELFGGKVTAVSRHGRWTVAELTEPAAAEWAHGRLLVSTEVFGAGKVVALSPRH